MSDIEEYFDDDDQMNEDGGTSNSDEDAMEEDEGFLDDLKPEQSKSKRKVYETEFDSLGNKEVERLIHKDAEDIMGIFGIDTDSALLLLRQMDWNKERLIEKYMDNPTAISVAAGVAAASPEKPAPRTTTSRTTPQAPSRRGTRRNAAPPSPVTPAPSLPVGCMVCCDESPAELKALLCDHKFCGNCWTDYMTSKIREGECNIRCMASDCAVGAPETFVKELVSKPNANRYDELVTRDFVAHTKQLKFCPAPSCVYTVSCSFPTHRSSLAKFVPIVACPEGHSYCFGCHVDSDHRPVACAVASLWLKKCQDDSETANWIKSNTKECPKCQSTIEKNGGCNHMVCRKCKHEFCWVCMGPWTEHGTAWYNCNRYDEKGGVEARDQQSKSRASLERYLHYYNRWANHELSAKLTKGLYAQTEKKMEEMQVTSSLTWIEVQFARKAVDVVSKCRMTLKWTYAMAYYLDKDNQKELFEDNQRDLERAVEELSELLEMPIEPENIATLRQKMTDKTVYVQKRNEIMLEDTARGFLEGRWQWNVPVAGFGQDEME